ncbi:MAG: ectonucleotide pyrophosphatase/phosphodiesterase [Calditrichaceae bacterium]
MKNFLLILSLAIFTINFLYAGETREKPYVIVVSLDGFRWDYPDRGITPNLKNIAENGIKALSLQPSFPTKTFPNHYTIVTGLYPENHGIISNKFTNPFKDDVYALGDKSAVQDDRWYNGETIWATAQKQGIKSASFFWPGSETELDYKHPTYFMSYDGSVSHDERIEGVINWLKLPEKERPHLIFLYFSDTDTEGHRYGPDSEKLNKAVVLLDSKIGLLRKKLKDINMSDKVNLIILSDHGMTNVYPDKNIMIDFVKSYDKVKWDVSGTLLSVFTGDKAVRKVIFERLKKNEKGYKVYLKQGVPDYLHYKSHPFIGDIIAIAEQGFTFQTTKAKNGNGSYSKGNHGFDNTVLDMHGIFIATGPAFKNNYRTGTLMNVDIYPLICKILGILPNLMIDGKFERIEFILDAEKVNSESFLPVSTIKKAAISE